MEKKLYCVRVVLYVMAENASGACVAATEAPFDIFECNARKADHLAAGWEDAIPYNADDERTCSEILASEQIARPSIPYSSASSKPRPAYLQPAATTSAAASASATTR